MKLHYLFVISFSVSIYKCPVCVPQVVGIETEKVSKEKAVADEEEQKVAAIAVVVSGKQRDCEEDLAKAEPALLAAQDALNILNKVSYSHTARNIVLICSIAPSFSPRFKNGFRSFLLVRFHFQLHWNTFTKGLEQKSIECSILNDVCSVGI